MKINLKNYISSCFRKSFLFCVLLILCGVLLALIVGHTVLSSRELSRTYWATSVDMIDQRLNSIIGEINTFPRAAGNDMVFLSSLSSLKETDLDNLEKDFLAFLSENTAYYQLAFVDQSGKDQILAEFDGQNYTATRNVPQNLYSLEWIENMSRLGKGEVFISQIKLTTINGKDAPIIVYAAPVYTSEQDKKGLIVGSVYANYFLDDIREANRDGEIVFLIDNQGNYLAHADRAREFGHLLGSDKHFQKDYPDVAEQILSDPEKRVIMSNTQVFSMRAIYPTKGSFALFKGAEKIEENSKNSYFWILISVTDKKYLQNSTQDLMNSTIIFTLFSIAALLGIIAVGYILAFRGRSAGGGMR